MREFRPTPEQLAAAEDRGGGLLVSAAAGSGKTRVLIERLFRWLTDPEDPRDIDEFLVITYTNAAAAELRGRIADELTARLALDPGNRHLQRQRLLLYKAEIGTVHHFCASLLREFSHVLDLSPDFRVADEAEAVILRQKVLTEVIRARYEEMEPGFALLADTMAAGRDDRRLFEIVSDLYGKLQSHPYPGRWLSECLAEFRVEGFSDAGESPWGRIILERAARQTSSWAREIRGAIRLMAGYPPLEKNYGPCFGDIEGQLERLGSSASLGWDAFRDGTRIDFGRLGAVRGFEDKELQERIKGIRDRCKKRIQKLQKTFSDDSRQLFEDMEAVRPAVEALFSLTEEFEAAYAREKRARGLADFSDLEHLAVRLLTEAETGAPSALAGEISRRYREIMVDEYQDTNQVQNLIFSAVSRREENLFLVGDVKQSIYRFRLADPSIFLKKYREFRPRGESEPGEPRKILLSRNFRSREGILAAANFLFQNIFSTEFGEMEYGPEECLYPGAEYPESREAALELDVLDMSTLDKDAEEESPLKAELEADFVAGKIRELLDRPFQVFDPGTGGTRPVTQEDIVILMRSPSDKRSIFARSLAERGISVHGSGESRFFESAEISVILALLTILDNPRQDIPLISVLRSPVFGFSPDRLAEIRGEHPEGDFYEAICTSEAEDCREFLGTLSRLRLTAADMSADRLIWHLYNELGFLSIFGAMPGGARRQKNLVAFCEHARRFESQGYQGLFRFVSQIRRLRENGEELFCAGASEESGGVSILSIHKSKGLEFPVVILADTAKQFNREDMKKPVLVHAQLGVGPRRLDLTNMTEYSTLARRAVELKLTEEMLAEELRVLYVALTRAKEKLIVTMTLRDAPGTIRRLLPSAGRPVDPQVLSECASMAEWILLPALTRPEGAILREAAGMEGRPETGEGDGPAWDIRLEGCRKAEKAQRAAEAESAAQEEKGVREEQLREIREKLSFVYPHGAETQLPSKLTATQLKGRFGDLEAEENAPRQRRFLFDRPRFVTQRQGLTSAERGTALHLVMQHIDFAHAGSAGEVRAEIARMTERKLLTPEQAEAADPEAVAAFFHADLGRRVLAAGRLLREFKFSVLLPAEEFYPGAGDGEILLQGVADLCILEEDGFTVVDFKTDRVRKGAEAERAEAYRGQLCAYGRALSEVTGLPAKKLMLYFFATGRALEMENPGECGGKPKGAGPGACSDGKM
ncbi:helicase-exonuclease AddAB subunit AddA [Papillibacter cinnamivorans]|uniref:DNA 3'-5' helicase n=1 Tax=Papillibacter cinnamivorans DSM 12816 TaxID=1122930 RepID=A0A1W1Z0K1_9FIRM|nr:helicase-exonuclease AddAB subunit AddA [Papillibacter cinnamivorans]SMC41852.1 DNA helicase/exodeoxyribonuclease V, subunit A [Papillibacter cinnamivorans DSM 12816]